MPNSTPNSIDAAAATTIVDLAVRHGKMRPEERPAIYDRIIQACNEARQDERSEDPETFDSEFGTKAGSQACRDELSKMLPRLSSIVGQPDTMLIQSVLAMEPPMKILSANLTERGWRLIRYAVERAIDTL